MGYMHIDNLYKNQEIMMFRECYAMEKIHGTSAHLSHKEGVLKFFSGAASHVNFVKLFDQEKLLEKMHGINAVIFGEAFGGKLLGMSQTYGKDLGFIAFDVQIDDLWLSVPQAHDFCKEIGLRFVDYIKIPTEIAIIDAQRDANSVLAAELGMGEKKREGVVLRPLIELTKNNGGRIMSKHKRPEFMETKTPREVDSEELKVLEDAQAVAEEWVTPMRIVHVLDKIPGASMTMMLDIIKAMEEDIEREGKDEIIWSKEVRKAIGKATAIGVKQYFKNQLGTHE